MEPLKVFWIEPTDLQAVWLRRYVSVSTCSVEPHGYHQALFRIDDAPAEYATHEDGFKYRKSLPMVDHADPRWPKACACGREFVDGDEWQVFSDVIYRRPDTGETFPLRQAPIGACWNASWFADRERQAGDNTWIGPDGRSLVVKLPDGHDWMIDGRASNCTRPDDNTHKCWVRRGRPEDGTLHVDKNGDTCAAGAGSILTPNWHGFLHNGFLHT